jgi:hypothetical protein
MIQPMGCFFAGAPVVDNDWGIVRCPYGWGCQVPEGADWPWSAAYGPY